MATVKFYNTNPVVTSWTDYYPFGYPMPNRNWSGTDYRFGFNGQEKDNEIYGEGESYTAEFWQYDSRLGRRWNLDPKGEASVSLYACFGDNPILMYDENGDSLRNPQTSELKFAQESFNHINEQIQNYSGDRTSDDYKNLTEGLNDAKNTLSDIQSKYDFAQLMIGMLRIQDPNIDNVTDENGNMVDIYVLVNSSFNAAAGVDVQYSENKDLTSFFGDKTLILNVNPNRDEKGNLINFNSLPNNWGKLLAHERGHLAYIIPLHLKYMKYLEKKGKLNNPEYNAHKSNDDPSVEISRVYENNYLFKIKN